MKADERPAPSDDRPARGMRRALRDPMSAAAPEPLRPIPFPRPPPTTEGRLFLAVTVILAVGTVLALGWSIVSGRDTVRGLPLEQRAALLSRTLDELRQSCRNARGTALDDHCRELASFAARFDECRGECEALVRPLITPNPTR